MGDKFLGLRFRKGPCEVGQGFTQTVWVAAWQVVTIYSHTGVKPGASQEADHSQQP